MATKPEGRKAVDYCYPSSPHACQFGHSSTGCFVLTLVDPEFNATVVSVHTSREDAYEAGASMSEDWHPLWYRYDREFIEAAEASKKN